MKKNLDAPRYLQLNEGGTPKRLKVLRSLSAKSPVDQTWRNVRAYGFKNWAAAYCALSQGFNGKTPVWYCHIGEQFRNEKFCDEVQDVRINHKGWFCDVHQNEKARGIVASLTHGRFIAGYTLSDSGERVYFPEIFTDESDAAHMADEHARITGEDQLEHSQRFDEAVNLDSEIDEAFIRLRECIVLRNTACMGYVRSEITRIILSIRNKRETLATSYAGVI